MSGGTAWAEKSERGNRGWLRFALWLYRNLGRWSVAAILVPITAYFIVFDSVTRRSSREWLETAFATPEGRAALRRRPGWTAIFRHVYSFSSSGLDRLVLWAGGASSFRIDHSGGERLLELARQGRGAILLGAHFGSFDMLRLISSQYGLRVNVLMFTEHAARVNELFDSLGGESRMRVIFVDPGSVQVAFEIKACLARGEFVGILADRVHPGGRERRGAAAVARHVDPARGVDAPALARARALGRADGLRDRPRRLGSLPRSGWPGAGVGRGRVHGAGRRRARRAARRPRESATRISGRGEANHSASRQLRPRRVTRGVGDHPAAYRATRVARLRAARGRRARGGGDG